MGFAVGPGKEGHSWDKASGKLPERARAWRETRGGLHMAARAYNTFGVSTTSYVGQLELPSKAMLAAERKALCTAAQGPGDSWRHSDGFDDLYALHESWGMPTSFHSVQLVAQAAQLRVAFCENWA